MNKLTHAEGPEQALTKDVLEKLGSRKETQRAQAEAVIGSLGAFAPDALMAVLRDEGEQRRRRRKLIWVALAALVVLMVVPAATGSGHNVGVFGGMFTAICGWAAVSTVQKNAARKLAEFDDIRSTGFLLEALEYDDKQLREIAAAKLTVLLPRLKASDAVLLTEE
ncbi:MAG TPA: hypothetical protein VLH79_11085, partial [Chthonomonadales bacterium]|nr:hypothetical protein [Chthonomonadales bacterium]